MIQSTTSTPRMLTRTSMQMPRLMVVKPGREREGRVQKVRLTHLHRSLRNLGARRGPVQKISCRGESFFLWVLDGLSTVPH